MDFDAAVDRLKDVGISAGTVLLLDDEMVKVAAVWPQVQRTIVKLEDDEEVADVWDLVAFDPSEVMRLAGLPASRFRFLFQRMRAFNFIYPDGTVPKEIRGIINSKLASRFGVRT